MAAPSGTKTGLVSVAMMRKIPWPDVWAALVLLLLPLILFAPVTLGGQTLLPADNLFTFEPYLTFAADVGAETPHNLLVSDLILENFVWKDFIRQAISEQRLPLWNPYIFAGQAFLANGQHSALYPLSILFYLLPLWAAYGWFTVLQLWLAGLFTYVFLRVLGANRGGSLLAGITFSLSGFFLNRIVFTMILAGAVWLPLVLAMIELIIRKQEEKGRTSYSPIPYVVAGAIAVGMQTLAGHIEITYYILLVSAFYAAWRLIILWRAQQTLRYALQLFGWLLVMMLVGLGLGAVQFIPFYEIGMLNFREGASSLAQVQSWALPLRRLITFVVPGFFGSPAHHTIFDLASGTWQAVGLNAHGEMNPLCAGCTGWDTKTAVEAGAYTGIMALTLTIPAILYAVTQWFRRTQNRLTPAPATVALFATLAVLSLLFAFGSPLYAILFYGLPGWNQLHSPFRWIYPFTLSVAVLAGIGMTYLSEGITQKPAWFRGVIGWLGWAMLASGLVGLAGLAIGLIWPAPFVSLGDAALARSGLAQNAFATGSQFIGYQWINLLKLFGAVATSGAVLLMARYRPDRGFKIPGGWVPLWQLAAIVVLAIDLMLANGDFNTAADPALLDFTPPAVAWLQAQQADDPYFRLTSFDSPAGRGNKILNANTAMRYRLFDVRGYDSVIVGHYAQFMQAIQPNGDLLYNRVGPLYAPGFEALNSALLDLLGVRYVLSTETIQNPGYRLVYDAEIKIYENEDRLPRAFIISQAQPLGQDKDFALRSLNPRTTVLTETENSLPGQDLSADLFAQAAAAESDARITRYSGNDVYLQASLTEAGWLVLSDTYFPGWKAYVYPAAGDETDAQEVSIHRVNGAFRGIPLPAGEWVVHFKYTPMSFKLGAYTTFLALVILLMLFGYWAWGKLYKEEYGDNIIKRIAKNSLAPMILALMNRGIDFVFALLMLRILAPEGVGKYAFAVSLTVLFEILTRFGLGTLLTREVARDHSDGNRYLSNVVLLRSMLWLVAVPIIGGVLAIYQLTGNLSPDLVVTVVLFTIGMFFSNIADALSALYYAYEQAEYPAFISTITTVTRVALGALVLLLGGGIIGLAGVSVIGNLVSVTVLGWIFYRKIFQPQFERDGALQQEMMRESFPLMINHLLATVFFRIDVFILKPTWGDEAVGYYNAAYKYIDGINIIPQYFTLAIFPLMSRYAKDSQESLIRAYILSLRLLQMLALPIAFGTPFIAHDLILILGGQAYLPQSKIALQLLIWFLPFSFINQVTQYVLIAINQQRFLTKAFIIGVTFNVIANLLLVPRYGYAAAAITTILSEWSLLLPFYYAVRKNLTRIAWVDVIWRPLIAAVVMAAVLWVIRDWGSLVLLPVAGVVYLGMLWLVGGYRQPDMDLIWAALPLRRRKNPNH